MATISCKAPTGVCSFISLQRQQHFMCQVECRMKSGCESLMSDAFSVQSAASCAKVSNIAFRRQGVDDREHVRVPVGENVGKENSSLFEYSADVEKCLISLNTCLQTLPSRHTNPLDNLQSIPISELSKATTLNSMTTSGVDKILNNWAGNEDLKHHEPRVVETYSVDLPDHRDSVEETDISGCLHASEVNTRSWEFTENAHINGCEASHESKTLAVYSLLSPLRSIKRWIVESLTRAFMSLKKSFTHDSNGVPTGKIRSNTRESSGHVQRSTNEIEDAMPMGEENDSLEVPWEFLKKFMESPYFVKFRVSISMANLTMTVSTFVSKALPILFELKKRCILKGLSISMDPASFSRRIIDAAISNLTVVVSPLMINLALVWLLWKLKHVTRAVIGRLKKCGAVEKSVFDALVLLVEVAFGATATLAILSSITTSNPSLAAPSFVALALAGKDILQNCLAGSFLLGAQLIQPGNVISVPCYATGSKSLGAISSSGGHEHRSAWFEGVCVSIGLTHTFLRNAQSEIRIPNSLFVRREFFVMDTSQAHVNEHAKSMEMLRLVKIAIDSNQRQAMHTSSTMKDGEVLKLASLI